MVFERKIVASRTSNDSALKLLKVFMGGEKISSEIVKTF
ncbi:hypothetical protein PENARI_c046G09363 [Penicillium arizonense]|uniref:Uncharacterized protein n=1 Tax=Penicillium arizonense TaxID=1835702 RepID=A0A1F5L337_PENAI|nr:hypothetical protein PENARI_c046G09363 [Penicillium arizonense]OGE47389.1 hypothetical protein PENARI_c046G09363 [Penicillium arizonense]